MVVGRIKELGLNLKDSSRGEVTACWPLASCTNLLPPSGRFTRRPQTASTRLTDSRANVRGGAPTRLQTRHPPETSGWRLGADITLSVRPAETGGKRPSPQESLLTSPHRHAGWREAKQDIPARGHPAPILATGSNWASCPSPQWIADWSVRDAGPDADRAADEPRGCGRSLGSAACEKQQRTVPAETERRQKTWIMFIDVTASCCAASGLTTRPMCDYSRSSAGIPFNQLSDVVTKYVKSTEKGKGTWAASNSSNSFWCCVSPPGGRSGGPGPGVAANWDHQETKVPWLSWSMKGPLCKFAFIYVISEKKKNFP